MITKLHLKQLIKQQKIAARKSIAVKNIAVCRTKSPEQYVLLKEIADERRFLSSDFNNVYDIHDLMKIIHNTRHSKVAHLYEYIKCEYCKNVLANMSLTLPGAPAQNEEPVVDDEKVKPRFGNLISVLSEEINEDVNRMESMRTPSQNDITRWALKNAVLQYYKEMAGKNNIDDNSVIVDNLYDERLKTDLAPDFDNIYEKWLNILRDLTQREDKYALTVDEYIKAQNDLDDGMRGSAFEKQLDRYRKEFMDKLIMMR